MSNPENAEPSVITESNESFADILKQFEKSRTVKPAEGSREATVISISADSVVLDIGFKTEGVFAAGGTWQRS